MIGDQELNGQRLFTERQLAKFISHLTDRQKLVFEAKGSVPRAKDHQKRWSWYLQENALLEVLRRRASFRVLQGGRAWLAS